MSITLRCERRVNVSYMLDENVKIKSPNRSTVFHHVARYEAVMNMFFEDDPGSRILLSEQFSISSSSHYFLCWAPGSAGQTWQEKWSIDYFTLSSFHPSKGKHGEKQSLNRAFNSRITAALADNGNHFVCKSNYCAFAGLKSFSQTCAICWNNNVYFIYTYTLPVVAFKDFDCMIVFWKSSEALNRLRRSCEVS